MALHEARHPIGTNIFLNSVNNNPNLEPGTFPSHPKRPP